MTATAEAPITGASLESLPHELLDRHPRNPRPPVDPQDPTTAELAQSIAATGQHQPCLVRPRPGGRYEILVGHRRCAACARLSQPVECVVLEIDDELAERIVLADNPAHLPVSPIMEGRIVQGLQETRGWDAQTIATQLGRPLRWVAERANLAGNLAERIQDAVLTGKPEELAYVREWPASWLLELAKVPRATQLEELRSGLTPISVESLRKHLGTYLRRLTMATWALDDDTLHPEAGSCLACLRTTARAPGLFDEWDEGASQPATALCRDPACWSEKRDRALRARLREAKQKHGEVVLVRRAWSGDGYVSDATRREAAKGKVFQRWDRAKKNDPESMCAIVVDADKLKVRWVAPASYGGDLRDAFRKELKAAKRGAKKAAAAKKGGGAGAKTPAERKARLEESKARIHRRRQCHVLQWAARYFREVEWDPEEALRQADYRVAMRLVSVYELDNLQLPDAERRGPSAYIREARPALRAQRAAALAKNDRAWAEDVWQRVRGAIAEALAPPGHPDPDALDAKMQELEWIAEMLGLEVEVSKAKGRAKEVIPDPRWWSKAPPPATMRTASAKAAKPTKAAKAAKSAKAGKAKARKPRKPAAKRKTTKS